MNIYHFRKSNILTYYNFRTARSRGHQSEEDKAKDVINKAKVEDDEYHKNANEEQTYYRYY